MKLVPLFIFTVLFMQANTFIGPQPLIYESEGSKYKGHIVVGQVKDEDGFPLEGVTVRIAGTQKKTSTDDNGKYRIKIGNVGNVLVFSGIGFATQEINVGHKSTINVTMLVYDES